MSNKNNYLTSFLLIGLLFFALTDYSFAVLAANIDGHEQNWALIFFFLPIIYVVYNIVRDQERLPKHINVIGLYSAAFFVIYSCTQLIIKANLVFGGELLAYKSWSLRFLPLIVWLVLLVIGYIRKHPLSVKKMRPFILILVGFQFLLSFFILFLQIYYLYLSKTGMAFQVQTPDYILSYLGLLAPLSYLIFLKKNIDPTKFKRNYLIALILSLSCMVVIILILLNGSPVSSQYNFEPSYYMNSLKLNYGALFFTIAGLFGAVSQMLISGLLYLAVTTVVNSRWNGPKKNRLYLISLVIVIGVLFLTIYQPSIDMKELFVRTKTVNFTAQALYAFMIVLYGFYIGLKKYHNPVIQAGLYIFPSFVLIYLVYYLAKIWDFLPSYVVARLISLQHIFLIVSIFVILYYTFETALLWYAYSHRKTTSDLGPIAVEKDYDIYVMIPCMNEELVIGNTLTSILDSNYEKLHIIVIDDASEDNTAKEVKKFDDPRVRLIQRKKPQAQQGKGEALNYVFDIIKAELVEEQKSFDDVLIAIIDADTLLPEQYFEKVNFVFNNRKDVTGLQSKVRVLSDTKNRSQDLEFAEIINATQTFRSMTGTVAFGGNGQFCKLSILDTLEDAPWSKSLVEDFDLSTRLFLGETPAKNIQLDDIYITQSGIDRDPAALVKQRVRWSQGNIQSGKYIWPIIRSKTLEGKQKFEFLMTLFKPWLMMLEYLIVIYTGVVILDLYLFYGMNRLMFSIIVIFLLMLLYLLSINFIWAWLYNRNKERKFSLGNVFLDMFFLTGFLLTLSQIYPQATIRHFKSESGWDKTKRQTDLNKKAEKKND